MGAGFLTFVPESKTDKTVNSHTLVPLTTSINIVGAYCNQTFLTLLSMILMQRVLLIIARC